jgi:predicted  nucleic acid-binding Zn-ribbon protein
MFGFNTKKVEVPVKGIVGLRAKREKALSIFKKAASDLEDVKIEIDAEVQAKDNLIKDMLNAIDKLNTDKVELQTEGESVEDQVRRINSVLL